MFFHRIPCSLNASAPDFRWINHLVRLSQCIDSVVNVVAKAMFPRQYFDPGKLAVTPSILILFVRSPKCAPRFQLFIKEKIKGIGAELTKLQLFFWGKAGNTDFRRPQRPPFWKNSKDAHTQLILRGTAIQPHKAFWEYKITCSACPLWVELCWNWSSLSTTTPCLYS